MTKTTYLQITYMHSIDIIIVINYLAQLYFSDIVLNYRVFFTDNMTYNTTYSYTSAASQNLVSRLHTSP